MVGPQPTTDAPYSSDFKRGMHLRRSSQNKVNNAIIMGWPTGILVDGMQTTADAENNIMYVKNSIIAGSSKKRLDTVSSNGTFNINTWFSNNSGNIMLQHRMLSLHLLFDLNNSKLYYLYQVHLF